MLVYAFEGAKFPPRKIFEEDAKTYFRVVKDSGDRLWRVWGGITEECYGSWYSQQLAEVFTDHLDDLANHYVLRGDK